MYLIIFNLLTSCFISLGIGIDDMFVIVQCLNNLMADPNYHNMKIETKLGLALRHAGVSVTGNF